MKWVTNDVMMLLLPLVTSLEVHPPDGKGFSTDVLYLTKKMGSYEYNLFVTGFNSKEVENPEDSQIEGVELTDGLGFEGGCNSARQGDIQFHATILRTLKKAGFSVVPRADIEET